MQNTAFAETLDEWLATRHCAPAEQADGGVMQFETQGGAALAACLLDDGRTEIFSSPGYLDGEMLRALIDDPDEDLVSPDEAGLVPLYAWREGLDEWKVDVRMTDGLVVLARIAQSADFAHDWAPGVAAFERIFDEWAGALAPDTGRPSFHSPGKE